MESESSPHVDAPGRILYVFPHPDDECFGPAPAIAKQLREGNEVHLLTLTRGGATRQRHTLGLSVEEMGAVRLREMKDVAEVLDLSLTVLDFPDSGLKEVDPRRLEAAVAGHMESFAPHVVVKSHDPRLESLGTGLFGASL